MVCMNKATRLTIIVVIYCERRVAKCVMDCMQASWRASCASRTHKCPRGSIFPHYVAWEHGQGGGCVRPGRTTYQPRRLAQTHDIGWRGNVDSVGHLCVPDAQLPCQDAWLKPMT